MNHLGTSASGSLKGRFNDRNPPPSGAISVSDMMASPYEPVSSKERTELDHKRDDRMEAGSAHSFMLGSQNNLEMRIAKKAAQLKEQQSRSIAQMKPYKESLDETDEVNSRAVLTQMTQKNEEPS